MRPISTDSTMPQNVRIRLNVGGTVFHTSLHTLMEGARHGGVVFQCLCVQILGPQANTAVAAVGGTAAGSLPAGVAWAQRVVPAQAEQYRVEHFVDADPAPFAHWLSWLRTGRVPFVEAGSEHERLILEPTIFEYDFVWKAQCAYDFWTIHSVDMT